MFRDRLDEAPIKTLGTIGTVGRYRNLLQAAYELIRINTDRQTGYLESLKFTVNCEISVKDFCPALLVFEATTRLDQTISPSFSTEERYTDLWYYGYDSKVTSGQNYSPSQTHERTERQEALISIAQVTGCLSSVSLPHSQLTWKNYSNLCQSIRKLLLCKQI